MSDTQHQDQFTPLPVARLPRERFRGAKPFTAQAATSDEIDSSNDDQYAEALRLRDAEVIWENFGEPFPSFEEMQTVNARPQTLLFVEEKIAHLKREHARHLGILDQNRKADMDQASQEHFLSIHEDVLDEKEFMAGFYKLEGTIRTNRHDDLRERVKFAYLQSLLDLQRQRNSFLKRPDLSLPPVEQRFPGSIDEFRKLKAFPQMQLRVARYLAADGNEAMRKLIFHEKGNKWEVGDTAVLKRAWGQSALFRVEVKRVINGESESTRSDNMEVDKML